MQIPEHIKKQLKERGGRYSTDYISMNARIKADNHMALRQICVENKFLIGNVLDYLIEGFIADYRQMWPVDGVYQTQLTDTEQSEPAPEQVRPLPARQRVKREPEYVIRARDLFLYPTRSKAKRGEDISHELEVIHGCLDDAMNESDKDGVARIRHWLGQLENIMSEKDVIENDNCEHGSTK